MANRCAYFNAVRGSLLGFHMESASSSWQMTGMQGLCQHTLLANIEDMEFIGMHAALWLYTTFHIKAWTQLRHSQILAFQMIGG